MNPSGIDTSARVRMTPTVVVVMLTLLLGIQPIATDLYLPALPSLRADLGTSMAAAQLTLSALIIAFGLSQLAWGPLADRFGRRPVLLWGMSLFTLASVLCAASRTIESLVVWRALQGIGMGAAVTCGRSIVRDLFQPHEGARVMSRALGGLGVIAMVSPLVGGALVQWVNWHAAVAATAVFGVATLAYIFWRFEETVPQRNPRATQPRMLVANWRAVAANPTFRAWVVLLSSTYAGLFLYLAASSFVFIDVLGTSRVAYGLLMVTNSAAYVAGTWLCRRLLATRGLRRAVKLGGAFSLAGGLAAAGLSLAGVHSVWAILIPQWVYAIGHGIHQPCGQAGAVGPFPEKGRCRRRAVGFHDDAGGFRRRAVARAGHERHGVPADTRHGRGGHRRRDHGVDADPAPR